MERLGTPGPARTFSYGATHYGRRSLISGNVLRYKRTIIDTLKEPYQDALIGFGNEETDAAAYAAVGMPAFMIDDGENRRFRSDALFLRTWSGVREFFDTKDDVLRNPSRLRMLIAEGGSPLMPVASELPTTR